ncbi:hypothetical protein CSC62_13955 [Pseudoxanthomonas jiangsuensis]|uniref:hypothetical protein n=1 Tax=Pseudoxanthomonas jiangsuensis TaxID=619688 RepID=UPI001391CF5B|nr:hypothetical protein [Pseudoxanthomonas jiangsuensis]KAF1692734.1 hypothetical protein CSC62_13955 [Pseudoxanthomonas jiangsuensis]
MSILAAPSIAQVTNAVATVVTSVVEDPAYPTAKRLRFLLQVRRHVDQLIEQHYPGASAAAQAVTPPEVR